MSPFAKVRSILAIAFALSSALFISGRSKHIGPSLRNGISLSMHSLMAIKLCIERLIPLRKDGPICFDLPEMKSADDSAKAMASILRTLANGDITPNEASSVSRIIEAYRKTLETAELEDRLEALEQKV